MPRETEYGTRARLIRVLLAILEYPNGYTKQQLADRYGVSTDTISGDFRAIETAGFVLEKDERHRYAFKTDKPLRQLKDLLHFSAEDQVALHQAIDNLPVSSERARQLKAKLGSLYDFRRLGHAYLRKPHLTKVDLLMQAKTEKCQVYLIDYRSSNSNAISTRLVEPFHISPADDTLQAFDVDKHTLRHFRITRFTRVQLTDLPWKHEGHHNIMHIDPFRIVDNNQVTVHLRLGVGAYNELVERYPLTRSHIEETDDPNIFDFQCAVNHRFFGLSNFILGFHHQHIEVLEPESLKAHLRDEVGKMRF
jgi:predicted DNA-binding transcriptional regulator YafY